MINQIFNENNIDTMSRMDTGSIDGVITSPPYNISSKRKDMYYNTGYSDIDNHTPEEYLEIRVSEFKEFQRIIKDDGVVLYNISYIHENPSLPYQLINKVIGDTDFTMADVIYWKKNNAIPFQTSPTKLSRIVEPVYVFVKKHRLSDFKTNKEISKVNKKTGQNFYKNYTNFIEAKNNDGFKSTLKAVYSTDLVTKLIDIYFPTGSIIYDPFMGSGTTALSCKMKNCKYIGSEIKEEYYNQSIFRLS
jgi:site-specific DNA-methyltransferase (adenine-specific)/modification methylase